MKLTARLVNTKYCLVYCKVKVDKKQIAAKSGGVGNLGICPRLLRRSLFWSFYVHRLIESTSDLQV